MIKRLFILLLLCYVWLVLYVRSLNKGQHKTLYNDVKSSVRRDNNIKRLYNVTTFEEFKEGLKGTRNGYRFNTFEFDTMQGLKDSPKFRLKIDIIKYKGKATIFKNQYYVKNTKI